MKKKKKKERGKGKRKEWGLKGMSGKKKDEDEKISINEGDV